MQWHIIKKCFARNFASHLAELKDFYFYFKTLSHCDIRHTKYFMEPRVINYSDTQKYELYCLVNLCHQKYTDSKSLPKRHVAAFK